MSSRRLCWRTPSGPRHAQGATSNHKNSPDEATAVPDREALGRSRGGVSTKIHLAADSQCRPVARVTSAGQRHDSLAFTAVMADIQIKRCRGARPRTRPDRVLADKAYSTRKIRTSLRRRGIKATIPEPVNQTNGRLSRGSQGGRPPKVDTEIYKDRNTVERSFNKLRSYRAVATRYDKRDFVYRGTIDVATIGIWLRNPTEQDLRDTP
jgi:transposase